MESVIITSIHMLVIHIGDIKNYILMEIQYKNQLSVVAKNNIKLSQVISKSIAWRLRKLLFIMVNYFVYDDIE